MTDTSRRDFLRGAATATVAAGGAADGATAQSDGDLSPWFENTGNYDGAVDETGSDEVTISRVSHALRYAASPSACTSRS